MADHEPRHLSGLNEADGEADNPESSDDERTDPEKTPARQAMENEEKALESGEELPG